MESIPVKYRVYLLPGGILAAIIVLILLGGNYLFGSVQDIRGDISQLDEDVGLLENRLEVLQDFSGQSLAFSTTAVRALPFESPSLVVSFGLKQRALEQGLVVEKLSVLSPTQKLEEDLTKVRIRIDLEGDYEQLAAFVDSVATMMPIVNIDKIKISLEREALGAEMDFISYWSNLPNELPNIDQQLDGLTPSETQALQELSGFTVPTFVELPPATNPEARPDPFDFQI